MDISIGGYQESSLCTEGFSATVGATPHPTFGKQVKDKPRNPLIDLFDIRENCGAAAQSNAEEVQKFLDPV